MITVEFLASTCILSLILEAGCGCKLDMLEVLKKFLHDECLSVSYQKHHVKYYIYKATLSFPARNNVKLKSKVCVLYTVIVKSYLALEVAFEYYYRKSSRAIFSIA